MRRILLTQVLRYTQYVSFKDPAVLVSSLTYLVRQVIYAKAISAKVPATHATLKSYTMYPLIMSTTQTKPHISLLRPTLLLDLHDSPFTLPVPLAAATAETHKEGHQYDQKVKQSYHQFQQCDTLAHAVDVRQSTSLRSYMTIKSGCPSVLLQPMKNIHGKAREGFSVLSLEMPFEGYPSYLRISVFRRSGESIQSRAHICNFLRINKMLHCQAGYLFICDKTMYKSWYESNLPFRRSRAGGLVRSVFCLSATSSLLAPFL